MTEPISYTMALQLVILVIGVLAVKLTFDGRKLKKIIKDLKKDRDKTLSQKKSSEVRLGKIGENMAPFFSDWPYDPNTFRFIGNPVDGIQFNEDGIIFVEIKTGKSRLSNGQKHIKKLIKEGNIYFATFRVGEGGCTLKVED
jgi:predicted Holliday junction resolvase-like endonuclease